jgi:hypothetical protein
MYFYLFSKIIFCYYYYHSFFLFFYYFLPQHYSEEYLPICNLKKNYFNLFHSNSYLYIFPKIYNFSIYKTNPFMVKIFIYSNSNYFFFRFPMFFHYFHYFYFFYFHLTYMYLFCLLKSQNTIQRQPKFLISTQNNRFFNIQRKPHNRWLLLTTIYV